MILHTLRMLTALKVDTFGELTVLINADEEIGSPSSRDRITRLGEESDLVISFEGSGVKSDYVRLAASSIARAKLTVKGRASHSGANPGLVAMRWSNWPTRSCKCVICQTRQADSKSTGRWPRPAALPT